MTFICFPVTSCSLAIIIPCTITGCCVYHVQCMDEAEKEVVKGHVWKSPSVIEMTK